MLVEINLPLASKIARHAAMAVLNQALGVSGVSARYVTVSRYCGADGQHHETPTLLARFNYAPVVGNTLNAIAARLCAVAGAHTCYLLAADASDTDDLAGVALSTGKPDANFRADRFVRFDDPRFAVAAEQLETFI